MGVGVFVQICFIRFVFFWLARNHAKALVIILVFLCLGLCIFGLYSFVSNSLGRAVFHLRSTELFFVACYFLFCFVYALWLLFECVHSFYTVS